MVLGHERQKVDSPQQFDLFPFHGRYPVINVNKTITRVSAVFLFETMVCSICRHCSWIKLRGTPGQPSRCSHERHCCAGKEIFSLFVLEKQENSSVHVGICSVNVNAKANRTYCLGL